MVTYNTVKMTNLLNNLLNDISGLKHEQKLCFENFCVTGFSNSTDWFQEKSNFSIIATACTERLVTLWKLKRGCVLVVSSLVSMMKDQVNWRVDTFMSVMTPLQSRRFPAALQQQQQQQQQYTSH